ncbi:MAG: hypothetical protein WB973_15885 [Thermoanaerobaculia bacterium]
MDVGDQVTDPDPLNITVANIVEACLELIPDELQVGFYRTYKAEDKFGQHAFTRLSVCRGSARPAFWLRL